MGGRGKYMEQTGHWQFVPSSRKQSSGGKTNKPKFADTSYTCCPNPKCYGWKWNKRKDLVKCQECGVKFTEKMEDQEDGNKNAAKEGDKDEDKDSATKVDDLDNNLFILNAFLTVIDSEARIGRSDVGSRVGQLLAQLKKEYPPKTESPVQAAPPCRNTYLKAKKHVDVLRSKVLKLEGILTNKASTLTSCQKRLEEAEVGLKESRASFHQAQAEYRAEEDSLYDPYPDYCRMPNGVDPAAAAAAPEPQGHQLLLLPLRLGSTWRISTWALKLTWTQW